MRPGARLAIDLGEKRIGVARCDDRATIALPVETVYRCNGEEILDILDIAAEFQVIEIIVGLPLLMDGREGKNANDVRSWSAKLARQTGDGCTVRLVDERLSSVSAHQALSSGGMKQKQQRQVVDQQAAVCILEHALNIERNTGNPPGILVVAH